MRPDAEHDAVLVCAERHQVVVAPPGTGKTYLSIRLAAALGPTLPTYARVLLLTFSRQARAQLEAEARRQLSSTERARIEVTNYHRLCWQAVTAYRRALGLPEVLDIGSSKRRMDALKAASRDGAARVKPHSGLADSLAEHAFTKFQDDRTPPRDLLDTLLDAVADEQRAGRLVFDDFGALFWRLLEEQPTVAEAYAARFPIVIADEHQDASALQDAIARRFGTTRLVVFADPMQLIHGFRGADIERLRQHWRDSGAKHYLSTPHRWHGRPQESEWLLALRSALSNKRHRAARPPGVRVAAYPAERGFNGALPHLRWTVPQLLAGRDASVAILVRENDDLQRVRSYLSKHNMRPRQLGGPRDFEEARQDIEQLPLFADPHDVAGRAVDRLLTLAAVPSPVVAQIRRRLTADGVNLSGAREPAATILRALEPVYSHGSSAYFRGLDGMLDASRAAGYHLTRPDAIRAVRRTADQLTSTDDLDVALAIYNDEVAATMHATPQQTDRGLFLMTAHQAKGKEFDAVVLVPLDARRWPDDAEHRQLLYVALTRATRNWCLVVPSADASPLVELIP